MCVRVALAGRTGRRVGARRDREASRIRDGAGWSKRFGGLEENEAGPSGGEGRERGIFKHRGQGQALWVFRAWGSGGDRIYRTHTQRTVRERGRRICPSGNDRSKIHA